MIQQQSSFGGGLNTLLPGNRLPEGASQSLIDAEVFDNTVRPTESFGGEGGGQVFYYEAGESWVGSSGFGSAAGITQLIVSTDTTTAGSGAGDATYASPLIVNPGVIYKISAGDTIEVTELTRGLAQANSFVEYSQDLYVGRDAYSIRVQANGVNVGAKQLTLETGDVDKVHIGDQLVANESLVPEGAIITQVFPASDRIVIDQTPTAVTDSTLIAMNAAPIRILDGNLNSTYRMGLPVPTPTISFTQVGDQNLRADSHSTLWYSTTSGYYPIPYQYGLSLYDEATGAESGMSELSDPASSASNLLKNSTSTNRPAMVSLSDLDTGKYALYRTGGTSSVVKKVANVYVDSTITGSVTNNGADLTLTLANLPAGKARLNWHSFNGHLYTSGLNSDVTDYTSITNGAVSFTLTRSAGADHYIDIIVEIVLDGDDFERIYTPISYAIDSTTSISSGLFLDFIPSRALIDIQPILNTALPPYNLRFVTEVNNFFFGVDNRTLYISRFADPNNWPLAGYISFDNNITALGKRGSDLLVFTDFSVYRVFGSAADSMRKVKVPTVEGVPSGLHRCVKEIMQGVLYVSPNGICFFDGATVTNLTKTLLEEFRLPAETLIENVAGVIDNRYYLVAPVNVNDGYVVDLRQGVRINRTKLTAASLHYRGQTNKLYSEDGYLGGGATKNFEVLTQDFDGGNLQDLKVFRGVQITGESLTGTLQLLIDDVVTDTFTLPGTTFVERMFRCSNAQIGRRATVRVTNGAGRLNVVAVEMDSLAEQVLQRWNYIEVMYAGTLSIDYKIDGVSVITNYPLAAEPNNAVHTAQIFFPAMTEGEVGHLFCQETETNKILRIRVDGEAL